MPQELIIELNISPFCRYSRNRGFRFSSSINIFILPPPPFIRIPSRDSQAIPANLLGIRAGVPSGSILKYIQQFSSGTKPGVPSEMSPEVPPIFLEFNDACYPVLAYNRCACLACLKHRLLVARYAKCEGKSRFRKNNSPSLVVIRHKRECVGDWHLRRKGDKIVKKECSWCRLGFSSDFYSFWSSPMNCCRSSPKSYSWIPLAVSLGMPSGVSQKFLLEVPIYTSWSFSSDLSWSSLRGSSNEFLMHFSHGILFQFLMKFIQYIFFLMK